MKKIGLLVVGLLLVCSVRAQDMRAVFAKMPDNLMMLVDSVDRLDMMDMYNAGQKAGIKNNLNDSTVLRVFTPDYLLLETGASTVEIKLLPMINDSKVICLVNTVCAPVCDSRVDFYSTEWKQLPSEAFFTPSEASWFIKSNADTTEVAYLEASSMLNIQLMRFNLDKDKQTLTQTYTSPQFLDKVTRDKIRPYLKVEPRVFSWNKVQFK